MKCKIAILALGEDHTDKAFASALLRSLDFFWTSAEQLQVTVIGNLDLEIGGKLHNVMGEAVCGVADFPAELGVWYREQLSALFFAAQNSADFSVILPIGSFAVAPISSQTLAPRLRARMTWESRSYHPNWWDSAKNITKRFPISPYAGPTILPAIMSGELARWTLDIVARESSKDAFDTLVEAALSDREWSALSLYATAAGSRLGKFHHDAYASKKYALLCDETLWSSEQASSYNPSNRRADDSGLFTYVHTSQVDDPDDVLDKLYSCLKPGARPF